MSNDTANTFCFIIKASIGDGYSPLVIWDKAIKDMLNDKNQMSASQFIKERLHLGIFGNFSEVNDLKMLPYILCSESDLWGNSLFAKYPTIGEFWIIDSMLTTAPDDFDKDFGEDTTKLYIWVKGDVHHQLTVAMLSDWFEDIIKHNVFIPENKIRIEVKKDTQYNSNRASQPLSQPTRQPKVRTTSISSITAPVFDNPVDQIQPYSTSSELEMVDGYDRTEMDVINAIDRLIQKNPNNITAEFKISLLRSIRNLEKHLLS